MIQIGEHKTMDNIEGAYQKYLRDFKQSRGEFRSDTSSVQPFRDPIEAGARQVHFQAEVGSRFAEISAGGSFSRARVQPRGADRPDVGQEKGRPVVIFSQ